MSCTKQKSFSGISIVLLIYIFPNQTMYQVQDIISDMFEIEITHIESALNSYNPQAIINLLDSGLYPNSIFKFSGILMSLLERASGMPSGNYKIIATLLKHGAKPTPITKTMPILEAAHASNNKGILTLLSAGKTDLKVTTQDNLTPLMFTCYRKNIYGMKLLLAAGAIESYTIKAISPPIFKSKTALEIVKKKYYPLAHFSHSAQQITTLKKEVAKWKHYLALKPKIVSLFKNNSLYGEQYDGKLVELPLLPQELIIELIEYMRPQYDLDFQLDAKVVKGIKDGLGIEKLPYWVTKSLRVSLNEELSK